MLAGDHLVLPSAVDDERVYIHMMRVSVHMMRVYVHMMQWHVHEVSRHVVLKSEHKLHVETKQLPLPNQPSLSCMFISENNRTVLLALYRALANGGIGRNTIRCRGRPIDSLLASVVVIVGSLTQEVSLSKQA